MNRQPVFFLWLILLSTECLSLSPSRDSSSPHIPFIEDSTGSGKLRTVYYDVRNTKKNTTSGAWTGGLWLNVNSGYLADIVKLSGSCYSAVKLYMPEHNVHSYQLLNSNNEGFSKLGQAFVELKLPSKDTNRTASFTFGRQALRTGLVYGSSSRTVPSTWHGYNLRGRINNLSVGFALVDRMSLRNQAGFHELKNFSGQTIDYLIGSELLYTVMLSNKHEIKVRYRNGFAKDFLKAHNGDISINTAFNQRTQLNLGARYYTSRKAGSLWTGSGWCGERLFENKASAINFYGKFTKNEWQFHAGVSHFKAPSSLKISEDNYTSPGVYYYDFGANTHGAWDINTSGFAEHMLYDGETVWMLGTTYSFSKPSFNGLKIGYAFHYGSGIKMASANKKNTTASEYEHDFYMMYAFPDTVLSGLKFKLKYGIYNNSHVLQKSHS